MARKRNRPRNRQRGKPIMQDERAMMPQGEPMMEGMPPTGMAATVPQAQENATDDSKKLDASPEQQALYHKFMENYYTLMYVEGTKAGPKGEPPVIRDVEAALRDIPDPTDALATAAQTVVSSLADSAEQAGKPIPPDVLMHAGVEVVEDLAELSEANGFHDGYDYTPEDLGVALQKGMQLYSSLKGGNPEAYKEDFDALVAADKAGTLETLLPGISEVGKRIPDSQPIPEEPVPGMPPTGMGRA